MNFDKFIKLMMMTTSPNDGEALNALRMANAELVKMNRNWEEVLKGKLLGTKADEKTTSGQHVDADKINAMFEKAFHDVNPAGSFYNFLTSIHEWWEEKGFLTQAQYQALVKAAR